MDWMDLVSLSGSGPLPVCFAGWGRGEGKPEPLREKGALLVPLDGGEFLPMSLLGV
jgi:hypothetical protein